MNKQKTQQGGQCGKVPEVDLWPLHADTQMPGHPCIYVYT